MNRELGTENREPFHLFRALSRVGPAIIIASVVLGPGSMLVSSKVGCEYGYSMLWILVLAGVLMIGMTALAARVGVATEGTLCSELAARLGRPWAVLIGLLLFLVVASFQSSNNMAVIASVESVMASTGSTSPEAGDQGSKTVNVVALLVFNGLIIGLLFSLKQLYKPLEGLMKLLLLVMLLGFGANLLLSDISFTGVLRGLVPSVPWDTAGGFWARRDAGGTIADPLWALQGMIATTFSVGAAFYQGYLVKEKGWTDTDLRQGLVDSVFGIAVLVGCSAMIMVTSAAVLHGNVSPDQLRSAADVATQLEPLFGRSATVLFSCGLFAACFSSFLVNAMIGGVLFSDGLGLGGSIDGRWSRRLTVIALLIGMAVAIYATVSGKSPVGVIIFAQALTVLGVPLVALSLLYLACSRDIRERVAIPAWMLGLGVIGLLVTVVLAARTAGKLYVQLSGVGREPSLHATALIEPSAAMRVTQTAEGVLISENDRPVLFFQREPRSQEGRLKRAAYVHPLYGLDGEVLTEDFSEDHPHQRGIFWAWHQIYVGDLRIGDAWTTEDFLAVVRSLKVQDQGPEFATIIVESDWTSPKFTDGQNDPIPFVQERVFIRAYQSADNAQYIDFEVQLTATVDGVRIGGAAGEPGYSGFTVRVKPPREMRIRDEHHQLDEDGVGITSHWSDVSGYFDEKETLSGVAILSHPTLPEFPPKWLLRHYGMQNVLYPGPEPIELKVGEDLVLRHRLVVHRGEADDPLISAHQRIYAAQPTK
jgi:manganese transport protein